MNINEKIRLQAMMNAEEIQTVIEETETGNTSISGLIVICEDLSRMILLCADEIQNGDDQAGISAYQSHINIIYSELSVLNETIITLINSVTYIDESKIVGILDRLKRVLLELAYI